MMLYIMISYDFLCNFYESRIRNVSTCEVLYYQQKLDKEKTYHVYQSYLKTIKTSVYNSTFLFYNFCLFFCL